MANQQKGMQQDRAYSAVVVNNHNNMYPRPHHSLLLIYHHYPLSFNEIVNEETTYRSVSMFLISVAPRHPKHSNSPSPIWKQLYTVSQSKIFHITVIRNIRSYFSNYCKALSNLINIVINNSEECWYSVGLKARSCSSRNSDRGTLIREIST